MLEIKYKYQIWSQLTKEEEKEEPRDQQRENHFDDARWCGARLCKKETLKSYINSFKMEKPQKVIKKFS